MTKWIEWTDHEEMVVRTAHEILTISEVVDLLPRRTAGAIYNKARELHVRLLPSPIGGSKTRPIFSDEEIAVIRDNAGTLTARQIAALLPRRKRVQVLQWASRNKVSLARLLPE